MRILYVCRFYSEYLAAHYAATPALALESYATQAAALRRDSFGWAGVWSEALAPCGYEVKELYIDVRPLEHAWLRETPAQHNVMPDGRAIAVAQARAFRPDVVFFDCGDRELLLAMKAQIPSIRLVLGWEGSALARRHLWSEIDLMLSCAPESVEILRAAGVASEHLHHAFSPAVLGGLRPAEHRYELSFFGQILRGTDLHLRREKILEALVDSGVPLSLFSPGGDPGLRGDLRAGAKIAAFALHQALRRAGTPKRLRRRLPFWNLGEESVPMPSMPVSRKLGRRLMPGKFGLDMYQAIRDSRVSLNIHADSSPRYASNMRLFEITGAGACMLTDRKQNIGELFEPDREVVVYENAADCAEKARWLLAHESERAKIAAAGQRRTLAEHTFLHRGRQLDALIRRKLD